MSWDAPAMNREYPHAGGKLLVLRDAFGNGVASKHWRIPAYG